MPRSNQPRRRRTSSRRLADANDAGELNLNRARMGIPASESAPDGVWAVRAISAGNAQKVYSCPGCHHQINPGVSHLVVWQEDAMFGDEAGLRDRRHWHSNCWRGRSYRYR